MEILKTVLTNYLPFHLFFTAICLYNMIWALIKVRMQPKELFKSVNSNVYIVLSYTLLSPIVYIALCAKKIAYFILHVLMLLTFTINMYVADNKILLISLISIYAVYVAFGSLSLRSNYTKTK